MINQQLFNFVQQSLQRGSTKEKITSDLISGGWTPSDIEECFNAITSPASPATPVSISANDNVISQKVIETIPSISFLKIKNKSFFSFFI